MNKKAATPRVALVYLLLGLVFTVFMLLFIQGSASEISDEVITRESCGKTVDRMSQFNRFHVPVSDRSLNCPTLFFTIDDEKNNEENNQKIANTMYLCAKQFRRGNVELFTNDAVHCNVCYVFDIQTDAAVTGLTSYLRENTVPEKSGDTYAEYMVGYKTEGAEELLGKLEHELTVTKPAGTTPEGIDVPEEETQIVPADVIDNFILEPGNQYAVIFIYARGQDNLQKVWRHVTAQTPAGKAGLAGGGIAFLTFAGGGTAMAISTPFIAATGPVGWVIIGTGVVVGVAAFAAFEFFTEYFSPDTPPEWASFFVLRDWSESNVRTLLRDDIGCDYFA